MGQFTRSYTFKILSFPFRFLWDTWAGFWRVVNGDNHLHRSFWKRVVLLHFAAAFAVWGVYLSPYKIVYNPTPSEKIGFWITSPLPSNLDKIEYGSPVVARYNCNLKRVDGSCLNQGIASVRDGEKVIKRVLGKPGDRVTLETDSESGPPYRVITRTNGEIHKSGDINILSASGSVIHFFPSKGYTLNEGQYYLGNDRVANAFDARYYGPSSSSDILYSADFLF